MKNTAICFFTLFILYSISTLVSNTVYAQTTVEKEEKKPEKGTGGINMLVLGDSLTSGHGLDVTYSYSNILQNTLRQFGYPVNVINASIAGSTTSGGYSRLAWHLRQKNKISLVVVALGYNDALHGIPFTQTSRSMENILELLDSSSIPIVLMGMKAPPNLGKPYAKTFDALYSKMSTQFNTPFYPFFLDSIALRPTFNLSDRVHPNERGVNMLVQSTAPIIMYAVYEVLNGRKPVKHPKRNISKNQQTRPKGTPPKP